MSRVEHLLVVDDEELNRVILEENLGDEYEVDCAADGAEALALIQANPTRYVGVVTDLSMPVMSGIELLAKLQEMEYSKHVPVVVVTSESPLEVEVECLSLGAIDFVSKPYHIPVVRCRVRNVVDLFKYQHHLEEEVEYRTRQIVEKNALLEQQAAQLRGYAGQLCNN